MSEGGDPGQVSTSERDRFRTRLAGRPLRDSAREEERAGGAVGDERACLDELVLSRPDLVGTIHREYLDAGADIVETATFGANRIRLAGWGPVSYTHLTLQT